MKWSIVGLVTLGIAAAFCAALLVSTLGREAKAAPDPGAKIVKVLVAAGDLPAVTILEDSGIKEVEMKVSEAPEGYQTNRVQVIGRLLKQQVVEGQALTESCFAKNTPGLAVVSALKPGKRAVTVELTHSAGLEGLLYPGAIVDVLASFRLRTNHQSALQGNALSTTLLQEVEVLAIDEMTVADEEVEEEEDKPKTKSVVNRRGRRVTLLVDTKQAEALQLANDHGSISLAMRNPNDEAVVDEEATLLSGGRLANLAEFLETSVRDDGTSGERVSLDPTPEPVATSDDPAPKPAPAKADQRWQVTVNRGMKSEKVEFELKN